MSGTRTRIGRVAPCLTVDDLEDAIAFYERLGFCPLRRFASSSYVILVRDEAELHLRLAGTAGGACYLRVTGLSRLHAIWAAAGIEQLSALRVEPWGMREFTVTDPSGNELRFGEPIDAVLPPSD